ncbi:MAG TPA: hypothetical protein VFU00_01860 [Gemmatimonadales bacterium]|nr:hypothetical protein [Gemmatimonadales bacterium]
MAGGAGELYIPAVPDSPRPDGWDAASSALAELLTRTARGPRREGVFALWLTVRVVQDLLLDPPPADRAHRRRVAALEARLATLTVPAPLRRALAAAFVELRSAETASAPVILSQLVAPARDAVGIEAGEAVALAARGARR